jgi:hypothetical protein
MESRFGHDFSRVRVHTGPLAEQSAVAIDAHAYTFGHDVVFGAGAYSPQTDAGRRLLAHELTHVVQQQNGEGLQASSTISAPGDASELEAERAADAVMSGGTPRIATTGGGAQLHRTVRQQVTSCSSPDARACLVHLHPDEQNAFAAAQFSFMTRCANIVTLGTGSSRCLEVEFTAGGRSHTCGFDPNRIFSSDAVTRGNAFVDCSCPESLRPAAVREIRAWRETVLAPAISNCRNGVARAGLAGELPVVAFHNNTTPGALSIRSYEDRPRASERLATEREPGPRTPPPVPGGPAPVPAANPAILDPAAVDTHDARDPDNFLLTTRPADFHALRGAHNTVLQAQRPRDDGSLSVALRTERYVNIEAEEKPLTFTRLVNNVSMAAAVLDQLGVPMRPVAIGGACSAGTTVPAQSRCAAAAGAQGQGNLLGGLMRMTARFLDEVAPPAMPREAPPASLGRTCETYADTAALEAAKLVWRARINAAFTANPAQVINWIIGVRRPAFITPDPQAKARVQKDCMLAALRAAAGRPGSSIVLPAGGLTHSGYRDFHDPATGQLRIWRRKWFFQGAPFDRISPQARAICGSLLQPAETQWNPANPSHCSCWNPHAPPGRPAPACRGVAAGTPIPGTLTDDQKQMEILEASSAPGISRHHWGTDFDIVDPDMNASDWQIGGAFADEYSWLRGNAGTYGFAQSFTAASGGHGTGYMEERWHWSYWPVAQALVDFVREQLDAARAAGTPSAIETRLQAEWGTGPEFSYIRTHFREYMLNVNQQAPL